MALHVPEHFVDLSERQRVELQGFRVSELDTVAGSSERILSRTARSTTPRNGVNFLLRLSVDCPKRKGPRSKTAWAKGVALWTS